MTMATVVGRNLQDIRFRLARSQRRLSSGKRIRYPSEDPTGYRKLNVLNHRMSQLEKGRRRLEASRQRLDYQEASLGRMYDLVQRMRRIAMRGGDSSQSGGVKALEEEMNSVLEGLSRELNARLDDKFVWSGSRTDQPPFVIRKNGGEIVSMEYIGDIYPFEIEVPGSGTLQVRLDGESITRGGGEDLPTVALELRDALRASKKDFGAILERLSKVADNLLDRRAEIGAASKYVRELSQKLDDESAELKVRKEQVEGVDLSEEITDMLSLETSLQVAQQVAARNARLSLVDFLR